LGAGGEAHPEARATSPRNKTTRRPNQSGIETPFFNRSTSISARLQKTGTAERPAADRKLKQIRVDF
jgi:hypothetical protein